MPGLGSKSVSSLLGVSGVHGEKSFEELRYEHLREEVSKCPLTLQSAESSCLSLRLLWILGRVLDCEQLRPVVVKLVGITEKVIFLFLTFFIFSLLLNFSSVVITGKATPLSSPPSTTKTMLQL